MKSKTKFVARVKEIWLKRHWLILAMLIIFSSLYESYELFSSPSYFDDPLHLVELIVVNGVILPAVLLTLQRTETQRNNAINTLALHDSFVYQLNKARNWDELIEIVAQFPRNIVPLSGVGLLMRLPNSNNFDLELARAFETSVQMTDSKAALELGNIECYRPEINKISGIRPCNCPFQSQDRENNALYKRYCLPLPNANSIVGLLHLYLPASYRLMQDQENFLNSIVPEIVISLNKALLQRKILLQESAIETERFRLASDLHDTLGQDLAYLRNKINQLIHDTAFQKSTRVKGELNQMSIVAEEANQIVRNILAVTHSNQEAALDARLLAYARAIGERANFNISLESQGQSHTLSQHMQFQIFLIFREILANIEKHANAHQVMIALTWSDEELAMGISDDGRGFLTERVAKNDHFGLTIIETRTREMNGRMSVVSALNAGTKVSIWLPINHNDPYLSDGTDNL